MTMLGHHRREVGPAHDDAPGTVHVCGHVCGEDLVGVGVRVRVGCWGWGLGVRVRIRVKVRCAARTWLRCSDVASSSCGRWVYGCRHVYIYIGRWSR